MAYRFTFAKGKKETCPSCNQKRKYRRYIDLETKELLPYQYGKCERVESCRYHLNPYLDKYHLKGNDYSFNYTMIKAIHRPKVYHLPDEVLESTKEGYNINSFVVNLMHNVPYTFDEVDIQKLIDLYQLGTINTGYMKGAITFPYINYENKLRAVQCVTYDKDNHRKQMTYIHSLVRKQKEIRNEVIPEWLENYELNDKKIDCLFGEHLLKEFPYNPIAIVEAPKTALVATLYYGFPDNPFNYIWLSATMLKGLSLDKFKHLSQRKVVLYPDTSKDGIAYKEWTNKAKLIQDEYPEINIKVSDYLENVSTDEQKQKGIDLADLLINLDWKLYRNTD